MPFTSSVLLQFIAKREVSLFKTDISHRKFSGDSPRNSYLNYPGYFMFHIVT